MKDDMGDLAYDTVTKLMQILIYKNIINAEEGHMILTMTPQEILKYYMEKHAE